MRSIERWLSHEELKDIYSAEYWNNLEIEKTKPWWIADGDYQKCLTYLKESGLESEFYDAIEISKIKESTHKVKVVDLAAGICWMSSLLSQIPVVDEVHAVEISEHRISDLCEHAFKMFGGREDKLYRYLGSFYHLKFVSQSIDYIFLSQAFHHADNPMKLLLQCDRILKVGGKIVLLGEHYIDTWRVIKRFFSVLVRKRKLQFYFTELFRPDPILGDHYYRVSDYQFIFSSIGYALEHKYISETNTVVYVATKQ